jgi:hypothetical protein
MSVLHSAEVRWIIAGDAPIGIKEWFNGDPSCDHEAVRIDYYLKFPGDEYIGIKLRRYNDGRQNLEFKPVWRNRIALQLPAGITGRVEEWGKWSIQAQVAEDVSNMLERSKEDWFALRKDR